MVALGGLLAVRPGAAVQVAMCGFVCVAVPANSDSTRSACCLLQEVQVLGVVGFLFTARRESLLSRVLGLGRTDIH